MTRRDKELIDGYIDYIASVRRYSPRTAEIYRKSLEMFVSFTNGGDACDDGISAESLTPTSVRNYEVALLDGEKMSPRTVNLHLSVLSGFCRHLMKNGMLKSNPVKAVKRPKTEKRLPEFFRKESLDEYFASTAAFATEELLHVSQDPKHTKWLYERRLGRTIISTLYCTGIRRSELIRLRRSDLDFARKTVRITGKGDKMREIPLVPSLCQEISLYLQAVETMVCAGRVPSSPLFVTFTGRALYPEYVDRMIKSELEGIKSITGKKSPHVLRHTLATELMNDGTDMNSIKELLGHSSLAATQVYTHNSIARLKKVYETAHPRANKNGGKHGD